MIIINSESQDVDLSVLVTGDLKDYIHVEKDFIHIPSGIKEFKLRFDISMPNKLSPGTHTSEIAIVKSSEKLEENSAVIGTSLSVVSAVLVYVPYPGKYLDLEMNVDGNGKKKNFVISGVNRGQEKINSIEAEIRIFNEEGKEVKKINSESISIDSNEKKELVTSWDVDASEGKYVARALVKYDSKEIIVEKEFSIGEMILDLKRIFVENFRLGDVAKFNLIVENKWNEPFEKAYAEMRVYDNNFKELADVKSASYDIPSKMQTTMNYYWDTVGLRENLYDANVILYYAGKKTQQDLKLDVSQDEIKVLGLGYVVSEDAGNSSSIVPVLGIIIGFLILLNLMWFFIFRKRIKNKEINN